MGPWLQTSLGHPPKFRRMFRIGSVNALIPVVVELGLPNDLSGEVVGEGISVIAVGSFC
jgi:hypothetical protein